MLCECVAVGRSGLLKMRAYLWQDDVILALFTKQAKAWAKQRGEELEIKPLTRSRLGAPNSYAELDSRIKAARTKVLLHYTTYVAVELDSAMGAERDSQELWLAQVRSTMMHAVSACLHVWYKGRSPHLTADEASESCSLMETFLQCYQHLASYHLKHRRMLYRIRPKLHYLNHAVAHCRKSLLNPMHISCFLDEDCSWQRHACWIFIIDQTEHVFGQDNMKVLKRTATAVHARGAGKV